MTYKCTPVKICGTYNLTRSIEDQGAGTLLSTTLETLLLSPTLRAPPRDMHQ
jgi:hypothetical protein